MSALYRPPAPVPRPTVLGLVHAILRAERDLLALLPIETYRMGVGPLGRSRRSILMVNEPAAVQRVLADPDGIFPKNDLMVGALEALVGRSIFVSDGAAWRRQRRMVEPAFGHMRITRSFDAMAAAVDTFEPRLDRAAAEGAALSLDQLMIDVTADIICRTIFSRPLDTDVSRDVFEAFGRFQLGVAQVEIRRLLLGRPFAPVPQPGPVVEAARRIRGHLGDLLDPRLAPGAPQLDDIVGAVIATRDPETGAAFTREELIDQLGVFFLAGHETSASVLTWALFILSQQPAHVAALRAEVDRVVGDGPIGLDQVKQLTRVRNVFREALRLYPPITFIPRVALKPTEIGGHRVKRGAMLMISPWTIHRHERLWPHADRFDPDRFLPEREREIAPGAYIPFGIGPRICVGAAFATIEATLILARMVRRYDLETLAPERVRPVARLTTRPRDEILVRLRRHG